MDDSRLSADAIAALLAQLLAGAVGGTEKAWAKRIGPVAVVSIAMAPRSNWSVDPKGTATQRDAIAKAVDVVRAEHPYAIYAPR